MRVIPNLTIRLVSCSWSSVIFSMETLLALGWQKVSSTINAINIAFFAPAAFPELSSGVGDFM
jgi:hypothetical protein